MASHMDEAVQKIMSDLGAWVKELASQADQVEDVQTAEALEAEVDRRGREMLGGVLTDLLQAALDQRPEARTCPVCGGRRRHKGERSRGVISRVGEVRLRGVYWYCGPCARGEHAMDALAPESISGLMREWVCLLGTTQASFAKASAVLSKILKVSLCDETVRRLCERSGRQLSDRPLEPAAVDAGADLVGSCDGTMVHTRESQWRELKAYQFYHDGGRHGRAYLESADVFVPRLRAAAIALDAKEADRLFFVSDAAEWIDKGVQAQLPPAIRIIDIWHAYQHIHDAARGMFDADTPEADQWARRWCERLRAQGGDAVWRRLKRGRYKQPHQREAVDELLGYLERQKARMDYPTYEREGYPISSGPMESMCKQLGARLKGAGMRWAERNVTSMAALVCAWINGEWDRHWRKRAG